MKLVETLKENRKVVIIAAVVAVVLIAAAIAAVLLIDTEPEPEALTPLIEPPLIGEAGVLRVGLDTSYPPFAGVDKEQTVGLDVDIAAAIAEALGLTLELVDVGADGYAEALDSGEVDISLGAIPISQDTLLEVSFAGSYAEDGPAFFSASETTESVHALAGKVMGAQEDSPSYWTLEGLYGEGAATGYATLREALAAADAGELDLVAGDAIVAAYIARDFPSMRYLIPVVEPLPLGVAVAKDADELEEAVRDVLNELAADGVLEAIHFKWVAGLPVPASISTSVDLSETVSPTETGTVETTAAE
jgi:polar amino acid transport system substrate-binding protein